MLPISPATQHLVEELYAAADHGTREAELFTLLSAIARAGDPGAIPALVPLLMGEAGRLESAVARTLDRLLRQVTPRLWSRLDRALRQISARSRGGQGWNRLGTDLAWIDRHPVRRVSLLGLASGHPNGFLRAVALQRLAEDPDPRGLPFLLLRLNDWVPSVRELARRALDARLTPDRFVDFLALLPLIERLESSNRDHGDWLARFHRYLEASADPDAIAIGRFAQDALVRRTSTTLALARTDRPLPILLRAAADPDARLQTWAVRQADHLEAGTRLAFARAAVTSRFPAVRYRALALLAERYPEQAIEDLLRSLTDPVARIRALARFHLDRVAPRDIARFYRDRLSENQRAPMIGVVAGLGETGRPADADRLRPLLKSPRARVRAAAVRAIATLAPKRCRVALLARLDDESRVVSRAVWQVARRYRTLFPPDAVWRRFRESRVRHVRSHALRILSLRDRWTSLQYLLPTAPDSDLVIAREARDLIARWCAEYNRSAIVPTAEQLGVLKERLAKFEWALPPPLVQTIRFSLESWPS